MASKTQIAKLVRNFRWRDVEAGLTETPKLINVRDDRGRNWLHLCCSVKPAGKSKQADSLETADVLLAKGLDLDAGAFREGSWQATALWYAVARGENLLLAKHLLARGADPNHCLWAAAFRDNVSAIGMLVAAGAEIDPVAEDETPFLSAVKTSHFRAAEALLALGADVDFQDSRGMTALHYMLKKGSDEKHFAMVVKRGASGSLPNRDGVTAAEIMRRKRGAAFQQMAKRISER